MAQRILVVDDSPINIKAVALALEAIGYEILEATDGRMALEVAAETLPDMLILDVQMPEFDGYEVCRRLRRQPAFMTRPILMLSANNALHERVQGLEAGADDYMAKPFEAEELQARVKALLRRANPPPVITATAQGKMVAFFSLRGGVGLSSLSVNLAAGLNQIWGGGKVALADMVFTGGHSALMLNLPLRTSWSDLASTEPDHIDEEVVQQVMLNHACGLRVLPAAPRPDQNERITPAQVSRVMQVLRAKYDYTIIDAPHNFNETTLAALDAVDQIVLVLAPEIGSIVATTCALDVFDQLGYRSDKITLLLNATFERGAIARKDIETALRRPLGMIIPYASEFFTNALNRGAPPVLDMPTKPLGGLLEEWAFSFSTEEDTKRPVERPSPALQRVLQRLQQRRKGRA
ncbi:response regulator receiver [Oscillochloris trichoides DG-6]|uniref:Response regulator receiver n=1 Tax=Oscillochloris trichoides DG-6 TaxID=765420 RepID=E1IDA8_9CHLR|nr:response regulator [Oscillochloris trichoides]EFO80785.1 response regulator receiver [Oscillochloris trichoides DG-6]